MQQNEYMEKFREFIAQQDPAIYKIVKELGLLDYRVRGFEVCPDSTTDVRTVKMPQRATTKSAGYDICTNETITILPGTMKAIHTGLTVYMKDNEFLDLRIRSGLAFRNELTLQNDAGVIDADYYGKEIMVMIRNEGPEAVRFVAGDRIAQGIFVNYLVTDTDKPADVERTGGLGHTGIN